MTQENDRLALHGGKPEAGPPPAPSARWGEDEAKRLVEMTRQRSLFYWDGPQTNAMLAEFRSHYPFAHCMPCSSGSAALHIAIAALRLPPGSEVIVPAITDMGGVIGVLYQQLVPVFADVLPENGNIDPDDVRRRITPRTRAIIPVHLAGTPCDMKAILAIAKEHNLRVVEDCAQAWGAQTQGTPVGLLGDIGAYSFNDFKHLSCGDGGIVATNDPSLGRDLCKWGDKFYDRVTGERDPAELAPNYRMSEPQAAVAGAQLTKLQAIAEHRLSLGTIITKQLADSPGISPMQVSTGDTSSYWFYFFRLTCEGAESKREKFVTALKAEGVNSDAGYIPMPVYSYRVFQNHAFFGGQWPLRDLGVTSMDYKTVCCPGAEALLKEMVTFRLHEGMTPEYAGSIGRAIAKVARHFAK